MYTRHTLPSAFGSPAPPLSLSLPPSTRVASQSRAPPTSLQLWVTLWYVGRARKAAGTGLEPRLLAAEREREKRTRERASARATLYHLIIMSPRVLLLLSVLLVHDVWLSAAQDSFLIVTSPESGDVFTAGDDVTVEWEASLDSSFFDITLLNDGNPVGDQFCDGGCLAPNGFLVVTLPDGLESGSAYSFLVGDRVEEVSSYGESETFEIVAAAVSSDTAAEDDGDTEVAAAADTGDEDSFNWIIVIVAVAAALAVVALCAVLCCCCKRRKNRVKDIEAATVAGSGTSDAAHGGGVVGRDATGGDGGGMNGELFASSGRGSSNGGASVSGLAELGALSPVHEESTEVVTRNPMISAMANGAQFHSTGGGSGKFNSIGGSSKFNSTGGGSGKFNSTGGSSKFASLGGGSSNGGYGSARGGGEEEEEGGGMFADAEVVAELAAAAAKGADKKDGISVKRPGSGSGRWDGNWIKSPAWNRQKPAGAPTLIGQQSPGPVNAAEAEKKMAEAAAAGDPEPEAAAPAPLEDWMVSTRDSFSSRKSAEAAAFVAATGADEGSVAGDESMGEKVEEPEDVGAATPRAPGAGEAPAFSPQSVDGISAKAFEQAEVVTSKLPVVKRPVMVVSEPECEVPKPALSARRLGRARKQSDYSWLLSASPSNVGKSGPISPSGSGDSPPQASHGRTDVTGPQAGGNTPVKGGRPTIVTGKPTIVTVASVTPAKTRRGPPSAPTADQAPDFAAAPKHGGDLGEAPCGPEQRESAAAAAALRLPPKAQGTTPRRTPLRGASRGLNPATTPMAKSPRGPRVSQVVDVFEGLTPKGAGGHSSSFGLGATPGRSRAGPPTLGADTPKAAGPSMLAPSPPGIPNAGHALTTPKPPGAVKGVTNPSGPALKVGAATWATPVATPDRGSFGTTIPTKKSTRAAAPEDMSKGGHPGGGGGDAGWATPVATPDRALRDCTPEFTARGDASKAGKTSGSPMDEGQFAWQLESPAGVDGLPSPMGSSGINALAVGKKGGRIIPAILGAANTPVTEVSPAVTPSTADIKAASHSVVSSGDSSIGGGWEMGSSFGSSRVAAFVADAQAEAAAEAHAAVVEAQAEAADEQAIEEELARAAAAAGQGTAARGAAATPSKTPSRGAHQQNGPSHTDPTEEVVSYQSDRPIDAQAQASEAALAAMAAATAAAEADAAAEDAAAKAAEAAVRAEKAAEQAAAAKAASRRDAGAATTTASGTLSVLEGSAGVGLAEAVSPNVVATPETTEGVGAMDDTVFINEAVGKPPEVYNDADNSDESIIDVGEEVDMGEEKDWMAAASPTPRTPNAASIGEVFNVTPTAAGHEEPMQDFVKEGGTAAVEQEHSENFGSFSGESSSGADTGALHRYDVYDLAGGEAAAATGTNEYASSRGSGGDAATPGVFRSARSILTWKEDDEQEEGDAEREAEEVQALVAEALALVQEANADD